MKTVQEWSLEFDLLYNNISSNQAPGLTEYEKSVFLTRAQETIALRLYNGTLKESFEETEEVTGYLASLVRQDTLEPLPDDGLPKISPDSYVFALPDGFLFRTYESCTLSSDSLCGSPKEVPVIPVTQDEYWRTRRSPFRGDNERRALRLAYASNGESGGSLSENSYSEIVSKYPVTKYTIRYLCKPSPIILENLEGYNGLTVNGQTQARTCLMPEALHQMILQEAVNSAKAVWA